LSRHEGSFFEKCPIYLTKNHHLDKKVRQREARMGSCLSRSKFASKKVEDPYENQVCFKSCTFPKDIRVCPCHHNLLQLLIFAFIGVSSTQTWAIARSLSKILNLVVK
jgi:hypothetical protein